MYLYMFSDGVRQSVRPPTENEQHMVRDGELRVFCLESGKYQEYVTTDKGLGWQTILSKDR